MDTGVTITAIDHADDYLGVSLTASNGRFAGSIGKIYTDSAELSQFASRLEGFPNSSTDERTLQLGASDVSGVTGLVEMEFRVVDVVGHAALRIRIVTAGWTGTTPGPIPESAEFSMLVHPASVDRFLEQLRALASGGSGVARLESPS